MSIKFKGFFLFSKLYIRKGLTKTILFLLKSGCVQTKGKPFFFPYFRCKIKSETVNAFDMNYPSLSLSREMIEGAQTNGPRKPTQNDETLKCTKCDYKTEKKNYLDNHTRGKHPKSKIKCLNCDFVHAFPSKIKQHHKIVHLGIKRYKKYKWDDRYKCKIHLCQYFGKNTCQDLKQHSLLFCKQCEYSAKTNQELKIHVQGVHEGIAYPCDQCLYVSKRKSDLLMHSKSKHTHIFFGCSEENCSYETYSENVLKKHVESEHEGIAHPCAICGQRFKFRDRLRNHISHKHLKKPFENGF